jgi:hypothetical protein
MIATTKHSLIPTNDGTIYAQYKLLEAQRTNHETCKVEMNNRHVAGLRELEEGL